MALSILNTVRLAPVAYWQILFTGPVNLLSAILFQLFALKQEYCTLNSFLTHQIFLSTNIPCGHITRHLTLHLSINT